MSSMRFASRSNWNLKDNRISKCLNVLRRKKGRIIDLTESNPTRCGFSYLTSRLLKPFRQKSNLAYTPEPKGVLRARKAVARYYTEKQLKINPTQIFLTSSTSESYTAVFRLLLNPNERILIPEPSYPLFDFLAGLNDIQLDPYRLHYDGEWFIDFESIERAWRPTTKAIILVHPNNPTGSFVKKKELERICRFAGQKSMAIISDEVFLDFSLNPNQERAGSLAAYSEVLGFSLGGISKSLGLPQMKLGWISVTGPEALVRQAGSKLEVILDTYLSVNTPVQHALGEWFQHRKTIQTEILSRIRKNYDFVRSACGATSPFNVLETEGGWYAIIRIPTILSEEKWALCFLKHERTLVQPGYFYDFPNEAFIVVSLIQKADIFQEGILKIFDRIQKKIS